MSKLPVVSGRECIQSLQRAGFYMVRQKGSHVTLRKDNPFNRITVPNHKTIKPGMLRAIIRDAGLTVDEFIELL
jgi:predicted RNA binding protein YcfA (HicA-like mRNA interferase family)